MTFKLPLLIFLLAVAAWCPAASPPVAGKPPAAGELRYRRVYFPEGTKEWAKGDAKYLPIEAGEFDRLIEAIQRTAPGVPGQSSSGFVEAQYEGRLRGQNLLAGSARLDASQSIANAMLMTLDPCNLAISRAQWITLDGAPAVLGLTSDGKLQVLAERSGQMKFEWSLAGQRDASGGATFSIGLPPCPVSRMRLELPADLTPTVDQGIVVDDGPADAGFHRWNLVLGGRPGCRLRLAKAGSDEVRQRTVLASQSNDYEFSLRGVEVSVNLSIDAHVEPLRTVNLSLDPSLDLVEVSADDTPLSWNFSASRDDKLRQVTIAVPPSRQQGAAHLRLRAMTPLVMARSWKLPRVSLQGLVCRSNTIRLSVPAPLSLDYLKTRGCRQSGAEPLAKTAGEELDFDTYAADAEIELSLSQRPAVVRAASATATLIGQGNMSSRVTTDFQSGESPVLALEADVMPNWIIDSVESLPTDGVDDWSWEKRDLSIRLARPLTAARPLRLIVSARRLYPTPGRNLGIDDIVPLRFRGLSESQRWVDVRASGVNELQLTAGEHLHRADLAELTPSELDLFAEPPGDVLFRDDAGAAALRISLERRRPTYTGAIRVEAVVGDGLLVENYKIGCTPSKSAAIDHVVVTFAGHRETKLNWTVPGLDGSRFGVRRWSAQQEASAGLFPDEENWDVTFRTPRSAPIEIRASRRTRLSASMTVCLASLPDAARQDGELTVRSLGPQVVEMKTRRLKAQPVESAAAGKEQRIRASYRYDPRTEVAPQSEPAMVLSVVDGDTAMAWVWDCELRSQFAANGAANHVVTYRIQNAGRRQIRLVLPAPLKGDDVHGIVLNKKPVAASAADLAADALTVDLPADEKFVDLAVQISTRGDPLGAWNRIAPPLPDIGLPVFARHWRMELPPGYEACSLSGTAPVEPHATFSIGGRLLGSLGRAGDQSTFNPLRGADWQGLLRCGNLDNSAAEMGPVDDNGTAAEFGGWSQFRVELSAANAPLIVVRQAAISAASWLLFLVIVGLGAWRLSSRPWWLLLLAVVLGVPALLLPAAVSIIFAHGMLGVIFALLLGLIRRRMAAAGGSAVLPGPEMASTRTNILPFGAPVLVIAILCAWNPARAETPPSPSPVSSVFIPVDDKQQPTSGKYFLPEAFFSELYRRAALQAEKPQGWMIASAVYRAALADDATQTGHVVDRLTAEFGIHVFNAAARVRIPLRRDEVGLQAGQAMLDDRAVQPEWESDGSALLLDIAEPGEYRLELTLRPIARPGSRGSGIDLSIPRVPTSRLEFGVPAGGPQVEFPSARGEVRWEEAQSRWDAEIGPSDRLDIRWPEDAPASDASTVDVEQLLWLKIEPGCVLLDVRMKAKANGPLHRLLLRADPALELLPAPGSPAPILRARGSDDAWRTYEIQWLPTFAATATFDLHFLWSGVPSLGTFRVPQIDVVDARPVRRWLAVSIDPALEYSMRGARLQESGAVLEFMGNWGSSDTPPELAYRLNGNAAEWNLATRPRRAETFGDQSATWILRTHAADVRYEALLTTTVGSSFQYRLEAPAALHVDAVAVLADGVNRAARWSQDRDGGITVFLASPLGGRHEIQLRGQMPLAAKGATSLPPLRLDGVRLQSSLVRLYRRPDVLVDVSSVAGLADMKASGDDAVPGDSGRPLRSFYMDPAATSPVLVTVRPNRPLLSAEQVTRAAFAENRWRTTCECRLQVSAGLLDAIELEVPASWRDGVKTSPAMAATIAASSDDRATLVLTPSAAISGDFSFTLSGPPAPAAGFAVPNIKIKHVSNGKQYLVLPNSVDRRPIAWALPNPRRQVLKTREQASDPEDTSRYNVSGEPWQAVGLLLPKTTTAARVVKSDVRYARQPGGRCLGAAFLDVETAGAIDCPLELPAGFDLLQFTVNGLPVDAVRRPAAEDDRAGTWSVPLVAPASTSHVEMLFFAESAHVPSSAGWTQRWEFLAPKLGDLPIESTTWTIASRPGQIVTTAEGGRIQESPSADRDSASGDIGLQWQNFVAENRMAISFITDGAPDRIAVEYLPSGARSWLPRLAGIAVLLAAVAVLGLLLRRDLLGSCFARWPYLFGVGIGLAWWLWLSPSIVGLLIAVAVLLTKFLPWRLAKLA
jgi:hypothetical protein